MNDFVDRLLGHGDAPPIRPMVPTLFEPVTPVESPLPMGTFTTSRPVEIPAAPPPVVEHPTDPVSRVDTERLSTVAREINTELRTEAERVIVESTMDHATETIFDREVRAETHRQDVVTAPVPTELKAPADNSTVVTENTTTVTAYPVEHTEQREMPVPPVVTRRDKPAPPPDVHISIGRVEIKARTAPEPRPAPKRKPLLSLDDYLRERR
ncbi:hypothetical protein [Amycolatopsis jejuensis]|uniref:hypothetical protein n=1 Tax=Amycolatopsis jejuensis TaxID=330084 RepID=UPI0005266ACD|nr:hypothetical protein [Amycolatopsis jejuensis]